MSNVAGPPKGYGQSGGAMARLADIIVKGRWFFLIFAFVLAGVSAARLDRIMPIDPDARIFFDPANPERQRLQAFGILCAQILQRSQVARPKAREQRRVRLHDLQDPEPSGCLRVFGVRGQKDV